MKIFRSIVLTAALVGLIVGLTTGIVRQFTLVPLILAAEVYEKAAEAAPAATAHDHYGDAGGHDHAAAPANEAAWEPADGLERTAWSLLAEVVVATGWALVLIAGFVVSGRVIGWREGLVWGLTGFAAVVVAPGLGLPPELPGVPAADLAARQIWWVATALATITGIGALAFGRTLHWVIGGFVLVAVPHVIGAPHLTSIETNVPELLSHRFIAVATLTSLLGWILIGSLGGALHGRFVGQEATPTGARQAPRR